MGSTSRWLPEPVRPPTLAHWMRRERFMRRKVSERSGKERLLECADLPLSLASPWSLMKFFKGMYPCFSKINNNNLLPGSFTSTLEAPDQVDKQQRFQVQLQLPVPTQTMLEATRLTYSRTNFSCLPIESELFDPSGGVAYFHRSGIQIWFALPQVQPLTADINTHFTSAVFVSPGTAFTNRAVLVLMPGPSGESSRLG